MHQGHLPNTTIPFENQCAAAILFEFSETVPETTVHSASSSAAMRGSTDDIGGGVCWRFASRGRRGLLYKRRSMCRNLGPGHTNSQSEEDELKKQSDLHYCCEIERREESRGESENFQEPRDG